MKKKFELHGYSDSFPSESIQKHVAPGLAMSVVFPYKPNVGRLDVPVKQYKDTKLRTKAVRALDLADWLRVQKKEGLVLTGFMLADTWESAADFGLRYIEELPDATVKDHYDSYRLWFGDEFLDFPQAVALQYYFFMINFGCLRTGTLMPKKQRNLIVLMDRFPHGDTGSAKPGSLIPPTPGMKFLEYIDTRSSTGIGLREQNKGIGLNANFGNLNWFRESENDDWKKGKTHPHFKLPDWLNQAVMTDTHYDEFIATHDNKTQGKEIADALKELCSAFKEFDMWMMTPGLISHVVPSETNWKVPDDAAKFVMDRAKK